MNVTSRVDKLISRPARRRRSGAASLDFMLILGALLLISGFVVQYGTRIIQLTYEMINVLVASPFM